MRIVSLAGGIGGARFLRGLKAAAPDAEITAIVNTGDDITLFGLRICPDLDTVMYTLGGGINEEQGWGRADESFTVKEELAAYEVEPQWFGLGDRDLATHIVRTQMLSAGYPLSQVTEALCARWRPGIRLLPMTDDRVETHVVISDDQGRRAIHFQEWWVRLRASVPAERFVLVGADTAKPAPGVLEAIHDADVVILPPSNPVVSIGTILQIAGVREALEAKTVVGVSPIIGGAPVRGMADACLAAIGVETSAQGVLELYGSALLDGWLVAEEDAGVALDGVVVEARPLLMTSLEAARDIAAAALDLARSLREKKEAARGAGTGRGSA
ncbi:2-phospho-L-lactate transferase [Thermobispora bispora]|jgi:LPPG:FO 2-phospho-L-lactate transferase|uniref:LPPG domain protein containing protein n=1 Tax=Thermobispora bispora (strain ATCC 19993 / DSM 43833 / CBS 139.67 / JCM 10125 / KCTC 9307 / NBRC 14880 / R51) TaxID=469371 RepID=D6Y5X8_THEBD|nr:2-phospho-L-lactate transferase [Thermobispora bispora]ADG87474.1 LPPG domain protein containing protein [Thermobispora bispora DSM 43833]MBO2472815.1 2-phospho-L-lactate transferase [Actinomycetales bacterium]MBX6169321.1 2-phospho-L-lactate transferase [Thermobispora bispora]MDI9581730.1 2-phospho-L-lactate transferase [Thermobispora sp.]